MYFDDTQDENHRSYKYFHKTTHVLFIFFYYF